jgi:hypothetical protein
MLLSMVFMFGALSLGLFFSCVAETQQVAMLLSFVATLIPTMLLSGFAYPVRNMPVVLQKLGMVFPATHFIAIALYRALVFTVGGSPESLVGLSQRLYPLDILREQIPLNQHFLWLNLGQRPTSRPADTAGVASPAAAQRSPNASSSSSSNNRC